MLTQNDLIRALRSLVHPIQCFAAFDISIEDSTRANQRRRNTITHTHRRQYNIDAEDLLLDADEEGVMLLLSPLRRLHREKLSWDTLWNNNLSVIGIDE